MKREEIIQTLETLREQVAGFDPDDPDCADKLRAAIPLDSDELRALKALLRGGLDEQSICTRVHAGVRYERLLKPSSHSQAGATLSVDVVHMGTAGPAHTHPRGEIDLCFAVEGSPQFDGQPEGWTVYPSGSKHTPTVSGGRMDIVYFLPGGEILFEGAR